jgi:hypothetical protein
MDAGVLQSALERLDNEIRAADSLRESLRAKIPGSIREGLISRIQRESSTRKAVDGICRAWVTKKALPVSLTEDPYMGLLFWDRFVEAREFAKGLQHWGFQVEGVSVEDVLEFLLVEFWRVYGVPRLKERLEGMP